MEIHACESRQDIKKWCGVTLKTASTLIAIISLINCSFVTCGLYVVGENWLADSPLFSFFYRDHEEAITAVQNTLQVLFGICLIQLFISGILFYGIVVGKKYLLIPWMVNNLLGIIMGISIVLACCLVLPFTGIGNAFIHEIYFKSSYLPTLLINTCLSFYSLVIIYAYYRSLN